MENQSTIMYGRNKVTTTSYSSSDSLLLSDSSKHGRSKAQICLQKIIDIISSGSSQKGKKKGLGIDLNLTLGCLDTNDDKEFSTDCSGVIGSGDCINNGGSNVGFTSGSILVGNGESECDLKGVDVIEVEEEEGEERKELSEVIDLKTPEIKEKGDLEMEEMVVEKSDIRKMGEEGYMDLLVEAARLISGEDETDEGKTKEDRDEKVNSKRRKSRRINKECRMFDRYEDISPIVKSKRGRNQVLPLKYRDSVLDPWKSTTSMRSIKRVSNSNMN